MLSKFDYPKLSLCLVSWLLASVPLILIFSSKATIFLLGSISILLFLSVYKNNLNYIIAEFFIFLKNSAILKFMLPFIIYAAFSNLWSLSPIQGIRIFVFEFVLPIFLTSLVLSLNKEILRSIDLNKCIYGFIFAGIVLVLETKTGMLLRSYMGLRQWEGVMGHSGVTLAFLAPVIFVWLVGQSRIGAYFFISLIFLCLFFIKNDSSKMTLIAFMSAYLFYFKGIHKFRILLFGMMAFYILLQPWIWSVFGGDFLASTILGFKPSAVHRLHIWDAFSHLALLNPVHGYGIASGHVLYKFPDILSMIPQNLHQYVDVWHPHNNFLELWLDLGFFGIALFLLFIMQIFKGPWLKNRNHFASFFSVSVVATCSHGLWQGWWIALLCLLIILYKILETKTEEAMA